MSERLFNPAKVSTSREFTPGQRMTSVTGEEYVFVQADSAISADSVVVIKEDFKAENATAARGDTGDRVGVAHTAIPDESYGWVSIWGVGNVRAAANTTANAQLYTTAASGQVGITSGGQKGLRRIVLTAARGASAGTAAAIWTHPSY